MSPAGEHRQCRVFVVDDDPSIVDTLTAVLNLQGYEACPVYSPARAVELAPTLQPDVMLCAVVMREMSGIDVAILVRKALPDCRIILLSGVPSAGELLEKARADGHSFEFFPKPVHPTVLLEALKLPPPAAHQLD